MTYRVSIVGAGSAPRTSPASGSSATASRRQRLRPEHGPREGACVAVRRRGRDGRPRGRHRGPRDRHRRRLPAAAPPLPDLPRRAGGGKHVICEKPLVTSLKEADALAAKVAETGRSIFRSSSTATALAPRSLRALRDAGIAGRCYGQPRDALGPGRRLLRHRLARHVGWGAGRGAPGHAIHIHDMLTAILGPVAQVYADVATRVNDIEVEDCAALAIRMVEGARASPPRHAGGGGEHEPPAPHVRGLHGREDHAPYSFAEKGWTFTARAPRTQGEIDAVLATVPARSSATPGSSPPWPTRSTAIRAAR